MARKHSNFMIGLFVTVGVVIGIAAIVWVGASKYFEEGSLYVTYFDESVQGLQVDSRVKYRGVDIGKVQSIGVAPDRRLVEVVMKIDLKGETGQNLVTQLRAAGITGIVFIELDRIIDAEGVMLPPKEMETRYPVIGSQYSQGKQMLTSVDRIMGGIEQVDLKGISDQLKGATKAVENFLAGKQMRGIMAGIDSTVGTLEQGLRRIDGILAASRVEEVFGEAREGLREARQGLQETRKTVAEAREVVELVRAEVKGLKAGESVERAGRVIENIDRRTRGMKADFERTTDEIRLAVDRLNLLLDRLQAHPADLFFSKPPEPEESQKGEGGK
jgi:phospholipid/cholesterol/gamma-HCH transport system substrate-binding protein